MIHPTAIIDPGADIGENVTIGPFAIVKSDVVIGANTVIGPYSVIDQYVTIGEDCQISQYASIGGAPQDLKFHGEQGAALPRWEKKIISWPIPILPMTAKPDAR